VRVSGGELNAVHASIRMDLLELDMVGSAKTFEILLTGELIVHECSQKNRTNTVSAIKTTQTC